MITDPDKLLLQTVFDAKYGIGEYEPPPVVGQITTIISSVQQQAEDTTVYGQAESVIASVQQQAEDETGTETPVTFPPAIGGMVYAIEEDDNHIYIGGSFERVNATIAPRVMKVNATTAEPNQISGITTGFNGGVEVILIDGDYGYFGGTFWEYNGEPAQKLAKINLLTGELDLAFDTSTGFDSPGLFDSGDYIDDSVSVLLKDGDDLYVGGTVSNYKGNSVKGLIKVDADTADLLTTYTLDVAITNHRVYALIKDGDDLYVGESSTRSGVAPVGGGIYKLSASTGIIDSTFDLKLGSNNNTQAGSVNALYLNGNDLYIAGGFKRVYTDNLASETIKYSLIKVNKVTGELDSGFVADFQSKFDMNSFAGFISDILPDGDGNLLVAGSWNNINDTPDARALVKVSLSDGSLIDTFVCPDEWIDNGNIVEAMILDDDGNVICGGYFNAVHGEKREGICKLDITTGDLIEEFDSSLGFQELVRGWSQGYYAGAWCLAAYGSDIICGGYFHTYGGDARANLAKFNKSTGALESFNDGTGFIDVEESWIGYGINVIRRDGDYLFVGGIFQEYNGQPCVSLAKIHKVTGELDETFHTGIGDGITFSNGYTVVHDMLIVGDYIYVAGFWSIFDGNNNLWNLVKIHKTTGEVDETFATDTHKINNEIEAIAYDGVDGLYIGGWFSTVDGTSIKHLAKISATTAELDTTFTPPEPDGVVRALYYDAGNDSLFAGGYFTSLGSDTANCIVKLDGTTGAFDDGFDADTGVSANNDPDYGEWYDSSYVRDIIPDGNGNILLGGYFTDYDGTETHLLVKVDMETGVRDETFDTSDKFNIENWEYYIIFYPTPEAWAMKVLADGNLLVGGWFWKYDQLANGRLVLLDLETADQITP